MRPTSFSDHAVRRYIERWGPPTGQLVTGVEHRKSFLARMLGDVQHVEDLPDENQSIWAMRLLDVSDPDGVLRDALLVVDHEGVVRTVLPPGSKRPPGRGKGTWR